VRIEYAAGKARASLPFETNTIDQGSFSQATLRPTADVDVDFEFEFVFDSMAIQ
jgi:hypothetical protein